MKKILSMVLVLTLVLSMGTVAMVASAYDNENVVQLSVDKAQIENGETVVVTGTLPKMSAEMSMLVIKYTYNTDLLTCNGDFAISTTGGVWTATDSSIQEGYVCFQLSDPAFEVNLTDADNAAFTVSFTAKAEGTANFELMDNSGDCDLFDAEYEELERSLVNTSVKIGSGGVEPIEEPTQFSVTFDIDGATTEVFVNEGSKVAAADVPGFPPSAEYVYAWDKDVTADITAETVFTAVKSPRTYTVTAIGATASASSVGYKSAVTVTAEDEKDGKAFSYFTKDGKVVSYDKTYKLLVYADTTIEAVYNGEASAVASAFIDAPYYTMKGENIKMVSSLQVVLPAGVKVESYAIYRKTRTSEVPYEADTLRETAPYTPSASFNAQGRLDYSVLTSKSSAKFVDIMFVARLSDGSEVVSNVVSAGASLAG